MKQFWQEARPGSSNNSSIYFFQNVLDAKFITKFSIKL